MNEQEIEDKIAELEVKLEAEPNLFSRAGIRIEIARLQAMLNAIRQLKSGE